MIVLGADMHKSSHTIAAVAAASGELLGDKTVRVGQSVRAVGVVCPPRWRPYCFEACCLGSGSR